MKLSKAELQKKLIQGYNNCPQSFRIPEIMEEMKKSLEGA